MGKETDEDDRAPSDDLLAKQVSWSGCNDL